MRLRNKTITKKYKKNGVSRKKVTKKIQKRLRPQKVQKKIKKALCHKNNKNKFSSIFRGWPMIFQQYDDFFDVRLDIEAAALPVREEDYRSWFLNVPFYPLSM